MQQFKEVKDAVVLKTGQRYSIVGDKKNAESKAMQQSEAERIQTKNNT